MGRFHMSRNKGRCGGGEHDNVVRFLPPLIVTESEIEESVQRLERACAGRSFQQRRDAAMIAIFAAAGIRLSETRGPPL